DRRALGLPGRATAAGTFRPRPRVLSVLRVHARSRRAHPALSAVRPRSRVPPHGRVLGSRAVRRLAHGRSRGPPHRGRRPATDPPRPHRRAAPARGRACPARARTRDRASPAGPRGELAMSFLEGAGLLPYLGVFVAAVIEGEVVFVAATVLVQIGRLDATGV